MKERRVINCYPRALWLLPVGMLLSLGGCSHRVETTPPLAKKESWETSFNRGDTAAVVALYSQNADLVLSGAPPVHGRQAIRAEIEKMVRSGVKVSIESKRSD